MKVKPMVVSLILALFFSRLLFFNPTTHLFGDGGDNYEFLGFQHIVSQNIQNLKHPFAQTTILRYPVGFEFGHGFDGAFAVLSGGFLELYFGQPLAYNLTILLILFLNLYLSLLFFAKLERFLGRKENFLLQFLAAIIFSLSPFILARINAHLNLSFIGGFPLLGYFLLNLIEKVRNSKPIHTKDFFYLWLGLLGIAFGSLQYIILLLENLLLFSLFFVVLNRKMVGNFSASAQQIISNNQKTILKATLIFIPLLLFFFGDYLWAIVTGNLIWIDKSKALDLCCRINPVDLFVPNSYLGTVWKSFNSSTTSIEKVVALGLIELPLLIFILFKGVKTRVLLIFTLSLFVAIALNFIPLPLVPEGGREVVIFSFVLSIIVLISMRNLSRNLALLLISLAIAERILFSYNISPLFPKDAADLISQQQSAAVLNIPLSPFNPYYSALPYFYKKKIADGYFHYTANDQKSMRFMDNPLINQFVCNNHLTSTNEIILPTIQLLRKNGIKVIVLHKNDKYYFDECKNARYSWNLIMPNRLVLKENVSKVTVYHTELVGYKNLKFEMYFEQGGRLTLTGILLYPKTLSDTSIASGEGKILTPKYEDSPAGIRQDFKPPLVFTVHSGQTITFFSPVEVAGEPIYLTLWYTYQTDDLQPVVKPWIEKIYNSQDQEVYKIN